LADAAAGCKACPTDKPKRAEKATECSVATFSAVLSACFAFVFAFLL